MFFQRCGLVLSVLLGLLSVAVNAQDAAVRQHQHYMVAMRMIGHQVLLSSGDTSSRILPIVQEAGGYRIRFADDLLVDTDRLVTIIDSVMLLNRMPTDYLVQLEQCSTNAVVYSYEVNPVIDPNMVACKGRYQPKDCYSLFITFQGFHPIMDSLSTVASAAAPSAGSMLDDGRLPVVSAFALLGVLALAFFLWKTKSRQQPPLQADSPADLESNMIPIGQYLFDSRNMALWLDTTKDELTSKETDLLALLHASVNSTVERDVILKDVWGDEGAYVGRTLDVFISKLRKKLEADPSVRIVNVRGIGYKLIC